MAEEENQEIQVLPSPLICLNCGKSFPSDAKNALAEHSRVKHRDLPFQCSYCGNKFEDVVSFKEHNCSGKPPPQRQRKAKKQCHAQPPSKTPSQHRRR